MKLALKQSCVQMRSGVELWFDEDRIKKIQQLLENSGGSKFINLDNETINTADIVGIFAPQTMEELSYRKKGFWKCKKNVWHAKNEECLGHREKVYDERGWYK